MRAILLLALLPLAALAAPFVEADVVAGVTQCGVVLDSQPKALVPAASLKCRFDLTASLPSGAHTVTMTAITTADPVWGTQESSPSGPFSFTKPATPASPATLRLSP
jgi:hypothetical protein